MDPRQRENPDIQLVETENGEVTLFIDGGQAMQAWERDLMRESAEILCSHGSEFLEVGLGLGISALVIAGHPNTRRHVVIEKYPQVIELFRERHPAPPATLEIVCADFFDHIRTLPPASFDGIFCDPALPDSIWEDQALWNEVMPRLVRLLRPEGVFIPAFSTRPVLRKQYAHFFDQVVVRRRPFHAYASTWYTSATEGDAFIQCFSNPAPAER
jgi:spermidine synthase